MSTETYNCLMVSISMLTLGGLIWYVYDTRNIRQLTARIANTANQQFRLSLEPIPLAFNTSIEKYGKRWRASITIANQRGTMRDIRVQTLTDKTELGPQRLPSILHDNDNMVVNILFDLDNLNANGEFELTFKDDIERAFTYRYEWSYIGSMDGTIDVIVLSSERSET